MRRGRNRQGPLRRRRPTWRWIGRWLAFVGVAHCALAVVTFGDAYRAMLATGMWNTLDRTPAWDLSFWYLISGVAFVLLGLAVDGIEAAGHRMPQAPGWGLLVISALGIVADPASGFWALLLGSVGILHRAFRPDGGTARIKHQALQRP